MNNEGLEETRTFDLVEVIEVKKGSDTVLKIFLIMVGISFALTVWFPIVMCSALIILFIATIYTWRTYYSRTIIWVEVEEE